MIGLGDWIVKTLHEKLLALEEGARREFFTLYALSSLTTAPNLQHSRCFFVGDEGRN